MIVECENCGYLIYQLTTNTKQMKKQTTITIYGLDSNNLTYCESIGLSKCFMAYSCINEDIIEGGIGFNPNSGYVYIALENGISICSNMGRDIEYLVTDFNNGEEYFFDTYEEAENFYVTELQTK